MQALPIHLRYLVMGKINEAMNIQPGCSQDTMSSFLLTYKEGKQRYWKDLIFSLSAPTPSHTRDAGIGGLHQYTALVLVVTYCFNKYSIHEEANQTADHTMHWMWYGTVFGIHFYKQHLTQAFDALIADHHSFLVSLHEKQSMRL